MVHNSDPLVLASASATRQRLLRAAGIPFDALPARVDEEAIRAALAADGAGPRDTADALAEIKARRIGERYPDRLVLGCDQVLDHRGQSFGKPGSRVEAAAQLRALRNDRHSLLSAAVLYQDGRPVWRHVGVARLTMRNFSDTYLDAYLARNWKRLQDTVGGYKLEEEGVRLFARIEGDHFTVQGLPLVELVSYLTLRGYLPG